MRNRSCYCANLHGIAIFRSILNFHISFCKLSFLQFCRKAFYSQNEKWFSRGERKNIIHSFLSGELSPRENNFISLDVSLFCYFLLVTVSQRLSVGLRVYFFRRPNIAIFLFPYKIKHSQIAKNL